MRNLRSEQEIIAGWKGDFSKPLVSVCCIAYNHEPYIEDALEGFLIQETDFPFEIIIHDDASTDKTADIIRKYVAAYPNIIKPILQTENQYSKGLWPLKLLFESANGNYIAVCEGDDYWVDRSKLQIQYNFLENNPSFFITGHDAKIINEKGELISDSKLPKAAKKNYESDFLKRGEAFILTLTWFFRNREGIFVNEMNKVKNLDNFLIVRFGNFGDYHYHNDVQNAVYRIHDGGIWSKTNKNEKIEALINTNFWIYQYYKRKCDCKFSKLFWYRYIRLVFLRISLSDISNALFTWLKMRLKKIR